MRVDLAVVRGPLAGRSFALAEHDTFLIGRSKDAHLRLRDDSAISRHHCIIEFAPPRCQLRDLRSMNGTFVNGARVEGARLGHGDEVRIGETTIRVDHDEELRSFLSLSSPTDIAPESATVLCGLCSTPIPPGQGVLAVLGEGTNSHVCPRCAATSPSGVSGMARIPGYRLLERLSRGSQGLVYVAESQESRERVAIKFLLPAWVADRRMVKTFLREMQTLDRLRHPRIVSVRERGAHGALLYMVMELVPGRNAETLRVERGGSLGRALACRVVSQALEGLAYAHGNGVIHRDFKPSNILVEGDGETVEAKLADFGLSKTLGELGSLTCSGDVKGSIPFMPPDQILHCRRPLPQYDVYSAGATLYHLLTGEPLYDFRPDADPLAVILEDPPVPLLRRRPDLPRGLDEVVMKAVAKDLRERYPDARFLLQALAPYAS
ncbi:MAG: protein kinase [Planctomycetes bacterium]|nr:protein kinase [Planctomycetota bacterium]